MKRKTILFAMLTIALCFSLVCGATYALFTSESKVNIAVSSGKVQMVASVENIETWSLEDDKSASGRVDGSFSQGGSVSFVDGKLSIDKIIPGDKVKFDIVGTNSSNVSIQYRVKIETLAGLDLVKGLIININKVEYKQLYSYTTAWDSLSAETNMDNIEVTIELPVDAGNEYQDLTAEFLVRVEAVQGNAPVKGAFEVVCFDIWTGEEDNAGLEENTNVDEKVLKIETASQLAAFAAEVNAGNSYEGYTVTLEKDIYLEGKAWTPIGPNADANNKFKGTFDGQNHIIHDLYVEQGAAYHAAGLFGALNGTVKNLVIDGAKVSSLSTGAATDNGTAVVAGSVYNKGTIDNVKVYNAEVVGNRYVGVIAGYAYANITNCVVENSSAVAYMDALTGSLDNGDKVGAIAGYISGESVYKLSNNTVKNCTLVGARDLGGIVGVISSVLVEFENNKVTNTNITYSLEKSYAVAGEFVSQRVSIAVPASNTFENVTIVKSGTLVNEETAQTAIEEAKEGDTIILSKGQYDELVIKNANGSAKKGLTIKAEKGAVVGFMNLNSSSYITLEGLTFDAAYAQTAYDGAGKARQTANIVGASADGSVGARNIVIDDCTFTGTFANGGAAIAFVDRSRATGGSGNITIINCRFDTEGSYYDIYTYYSGSEGLGFVIENNTFASERAQGLPIYLGRYASSVPVVVKGNIFETVSSADNAYALQAHSASYTVSFDAENNSFLG